jgi:hypothetical protein
MLKTQGVMILKLAAICMIMLLLAGGCAQKLPEPESLKAKASEEGIQNQLRVHRYIKGNALYIECFAPAVTFSGMSREKTKGKIHVYMDGQFHSEYHTAAFIVKDMPKGVHKMKVAIVHPDGKSLGLSEQFTVTIE